MIGWGATTLGSVSGRQCGSAARMVAAAWAAHGSHIPGLAWRIAMAALGICDCVRVTSRCQPAHWQYPGQWDRY